MSRLEELIRELCPDGVEYKKLGNVVSLERGKRVVKKELSQTEGYPVYQNSLTPLGYCPKSNCKSNSTFIIIVAGAAGEIGYSTTDFWAADDCFVVVCPDDVQNRYIYYLLMSNQALLKSNVRKASIPRLPHDAIERLLIPVPPLEVQREIVRILDNFTELTAELTARKKQYEFYRDKLLTFNVRGGGGQLNTSGGHLAKSQKCSVGSTSQKRTQIKEIYLSYSEDRSRLTILTKQTMKARSWLLQEVGHRRALFLIGMSLSLLLMDLAMKQNQS